MLDEEQEQLDPGQLSRLIAICHALNATSDVDALLRLIVDEAAELVDAEMASILLLDPQTNELHFRATSKEAHMVLAGKSVPLHASVAGEVMTSGEARLINEAKSDPSWNPAFDAQIGITTRSLLAVTLYNVDEKLGVIEALNKREGQPFTDADLATLMTLGNLAGVAIARANLIAALQQANRDLGRLDELKSNFLAVAAHELRTPLNVILGYVTLLHNDRTALGPDNARRIDAVRQAALQLRGLLNSIFNLEQLEAGRPALRRTNFDLVSAVSEAIDGRAADVEARGLVVRRNWSAERLPVLGDRNLIQVVINNLLDNAFKFTPEAGEIDVQVIRYGPEARLQIRDSGPGLSSDELVHIFDRFYQTESHLDRHASGLGIGLAISKELVRLHDGRIWAESEPGQGSTFIVALPLASRVNG